MEKRSGEIGNSTQELERLHAVALWAADCAELALPIFEERHPTDTRPREIVEAGRAFGQGKKRGNCSVQPFMPQSPPKPLRHKFATLQGVITATNWNLLSHYDLGKT